MNTLDVHLSRFFVGVMIIAGIFTCGVAPLLMWFSARKFPRAIDPEGLTLRNGTRLLWRDLSDVKRVTVVSQSGTRITGRVDLYFGKRKISLAPQSYAEGHEVLAYVSRVLGREIATG